MSEGIPHEVLISRSNECFPAVSRREFFARVTMRPPRGRALPVRIFCRGLGERHIFPYPGHIWLICASRSPKSFGKLSYVPCVR